MTTKPTHSTRLARLASKEGDLTYAQALELIHRARAQKLLPEILDEDGMRKALGVLRQMKDSVRAESPAARQSFLLGHDDTASPVFITAAALRLHTMILGCPGSGRSVTLRNVISGMLDMGWSGTVLDLDADISSRGLMGYCSDAATQRTLPYQQLSPTPATPAQINPLRDLGPDEARDLLLSLSRGDDLFWQQSSKKMLGQLLSLCYDAHVAAPDVVSRPTIYSIGSILEAPNLAAATAPLLRVLEKASPGADLSQYNSLIDTPDDIQYSARHFGNVITQIYNTQSARKMLLPKDPSAQISTEFLYDAPGLSYVGTNATGDPDLSILISSAVLSHAAHLAKARIHEGEATPRFLVISSAHFADYPHLALLLSVARGGGLAVIMCDHGPEDSPGFSFEDLARNVNVMIMMDQYKEYADKAALLLDDPNTSPMALRQLGVGQAVVRTARPTPSIKRVRITRPALPTTNASQKPSAP